MRLNDRTTSAAALLALALPFAALAQPVTTAQTNPATRTGPEGVSVRPELNAPGDQTSENVPLPISPPPRIGLFPDFGATLLKNGVDFHGIAFDHFLANPSAGSVKGQTANLGAFRPAVDLDLERIVGIPGGTIRVGLTFFGLRSDIPQIITQTGGTLTGFQTTPATQTNLLSLLTYEQRFFGDRLSIEAGRTNAYNYFLLPNSLDPFTHYSTTFQVNGDFASNPYPVWGARVTYKVTPDWYVQAGAFEDNYRASTNYGDRFGTGLASGVQVLGEVGYRSEFTNARYPANMELGLEWNTRNGRSNLKGTAAPANGLLQPVNYPGGGVIFLQGQQVVWRGADRPFGPPANVAVYGSADIAVSKPQPIDFDAMIGVNVTGLIPGRPFDAFGVQAKYQKLSGPEGDAETRRQRIILGPYHDPQARDGFAFELVGNIQVVPGVAIRPLVEYFTQPDNYYPPAAAGKPHVPHDGFEAGIFAVVSLGRLLGTSLKPF